MVKKLLKYDLMYFTKVLLPVYIGMLTVALFYRIVSVFENDSDAYSIINGSAITVLVVAIIAAFLIGYIISIVRFYKNLFSAEGYLSFTLPITPEAHILSKLLSAIIFDALSVLFAFAAFAIATAGELFVEVMKAFGYLYSSAAGSIGIDFPIFTIEIIILFLCTLATEHLLTFMCISIGQLASKHKILLAIGVYFGIYIVKRILATIGLIIGIVGEGFELINGLMVDSYIATTHAILISSIVITLIGSLIYFFIARYIIKNKLNLE